MKKHLVLMLGVAAVSGCVVSNNAGAGNTKQAEEIYYRSQAVADGALAAFDKANPSCQLWTNWQKMCSRTGLNGETSCTSDPDTPAKPSAPFCANRLVFKQGNPILSPPEIPETITETKKSSNSRNRFCAKFWDGKPGSVDIEKNLMSMHRQIPFCTSYKLSRPFNGKSAKSQENPRCKKWAALSGGMLYCAEKITDDKCNYLHNGVSPPEITEDGIFVGTDYRSEQRAVWGLSCNSWVRKS